MTWAVFISATTYIVILGAIKVSLCLLYIEIFPDQQTRNVTYIIMGFIITSSGILYLVSVFGCKPIRGYWHLDIGAKCLNMNAIGFAVSSFSIVEDVILLLWPLFCIRRLNMVWRRKLAVSFMTAIGTL